MKSGRLSAAAAALFFAVALGSTAMAYARQSVKIAFIGPLTGGNSAAGIGGRNAVDLAVQLHNADPKSRYHYDLVSFDDQCKPAVGVQVATKAASDNSIIGGVTNYCSATAIAAIGVYHRFGMPAIMWAATLPDITYGQKYNNIFRVNGTMINQNDVAAKFMTGLGFRTWVIIHDTTDYGKGHDKYFRKYLARDGGKVLADFGVGANQQDFTDILTKTKALKPQVIYFGGLTPIGVRIRNQMDKLGIKAVFEGTSGIVSDSYITALGPLAEGTLAFKEGAPIGKLPGGKKFMEEYAKQKYAEGPEAYGPFAFAAANLLIDAIEKAGPSRQQVIKGLAKTRDHHSVVGPITFDDHGQNVVATITKYVVQNGKWVAWDDSAYAAGKKKLPGQKIAMRR